MPESRTGAHGHVFKSYLEKVFVVVVAVAAFSGLFRLGKLTDEQKKPITKELLQSVARAADQIAKGKNIAVPLKEIADDFQPPDGKRERLTTQELTAQIEHLADAKIWAKYQQSVGKLKPPENTEGAARFANELAKEDALARGQISAIHALTEAAVIHVNEPEKSKWTELADEKSSLHVLYEIIWYALLIIGVLSCSYLLMTAFLALPFTSIDGEWTKRIEAILKSAVPETVTRVAVAPLAAAAVVAGTVLAGTTYATVPGGISREVSREQTVDNRKTITEGDVTYDNRTYPQTPPIVPPGVSKRQLDERLQQSEKTIDTNTARHTRPVSDRLGRTIELVNGLSESVQNVDLEVQGTGILADRANQSAGLAQFHASAAHESANATKGAISEKSVAIENEQTHQKKLQADELAQSTLVDDRSFLRRSFGFTMFKVGPAAIDAMNARMADDLKAGRISADDQKNVSTTLDAMQKVDPLNRWRFEEQLKTSSMKQAMVDKYTRTLLHLCALPRQ